MKLSVNPYEPALGTESRLVRNVWNEAVRQTLADVARDLRARADTMDELLCDLTTRLPPGAPILQEADNTIHNLRNLAAFYEEGSHVKK
jgi:hypothetical protein